MRLLIVVNNHNSIGLVDSCVNLKKYDKDIEVIAVCGAKLDVAKTKLHSNKDVGLKRLELAQSQTGANVKKRFSVVNEVRQLEKKIKDGAKEKKASLLNLIVSKLVGILFSSSLFYFVREKIIYSKLNRFKQKALKFIKEVKPDIVLSMSDRSHDYIESSILWAAKKSGIKIILPYIAQYDKDAALYYRMTDNGKPLPELRPFWPFSIYKIFSYIKFKDQVYKGFFFQAPYVLNASEKSGTLSTYPWWVGNGISDIVCVDSEHTAKKYVSNRVQKDKIAVVGHISYDYVYRSYINRETIKQSLLKKYSLQDEKKLIVLSMPQYAEQGYMGWEDHWNEINSMMKEVNSSNNNLLISIHPRSDLESYLFLQDKYNCKILDESLSEIIGAADLFLASNSTTFVWAVLCRIHSIALMSPVPFLYNHLESIHPIDSNFDLGTLINNLLASNVISFEKDWELLSKKEVFDGMFNERFLRLLHSACNACNK